MRVELILEGGGMRGAYTCGVLDCFMDKGIRFLDITAVSAGVAAAMYYVSGQKGSSLEILTKYASDKRYLSLENLLRNGSAFGLDFIFKTIPKKHILFNFEEFNTNNMNLTAVCTNVNTGKPHYELIDKLNDKLDYVIASASLPIVSKSVKVDGLELLDGGIVDPIPIKRSTELFDRHVLVLTRNAGYRKNKNKSRRLIAARFLLQSEFKEILLTRHNIYNESLELAESLEKEGKAIIIRPSQPLMIDRFEKNPEKLTNLYQMGYNDTLNKLNQLLDFCQECDNVEKK